MATGHIEGLHGPDPAEVLEHLHGKDMTQVENPEDSNSTHGHQASQAPATQPTELKGILSAGKIVGGQLSDEYPSSHNTDGHPAKDCTIRTSSRERTLTEKGLSHTIDLTIGQLKAALVSHRQYCFKFENLIVTKDLQIPELSEFLNTLERSMFNVSEKYHKLGSVSIDAYDEYTHRFKDCASLNQKVMLSISQAIRKIEHETRSMNSKHSKSSKSSKRSSRSSRSSGSSRSVCSHGSLASMKFAAASKAIDLKTQLKYLPQHNQVHSELQRIELVRKIEAEEAKLKVAQDIELESVYSVKGLAEHQASNGVMDGTSHTSRYDNGTLTKLNQKQDARVIIDESRNVTIGASNNIKNQHSIDVLNCNAPEFVPKSVSADFDASQSVLSKGTSERSIDGTKQPVSSINVGCAQSGDNVTSQMSEMVRSFGEFVNVSRLPVPEPGIFSGDPLTYPAWKRAFTTLIEGRNVPSADKVYYLERYLGSAVKKCVQGYLLMPTADAYNEATMLIDRRYGDPFVIAQAFKAKIEAWPKIPTRDPEALRQFGDFLSQCAVAARSNKSLRVLDDDMQNKMMLSKLPEWLVTRWGRKVHENCRVTGSYPSFREFVNFLVEEADIACNPVTAVIQSKPIQTGVKSPVVATGRTLITANDSVECLYCGKPNHSLDKCFAFSSLSVDNRKGFINENRLCFGCLKVGHIASECKRRSQCDKCPKRHPTSLHRDMSELNTEYYGKRSNSDGNMGHKDMGGKGYVQKNPSASEVKERGPSHSDGVESQSSIAHFASNSTSRKSTMILPVYVSHEQDEGMEILVYALLDTQSDSTFVKKSLCSDLGIEGTNTMLRLSTMTSDNSLLHSQRVGGLKVRGFDSEIKISLPVAFTHDHIPSNKDNIPSPEMTNDWPYLRSIKSKLMPISDCEVALLIGYNCPQALVPRDVIPPQGDGPYAQRTDLGWGIVGITHGSGMDDGVENVFSYSNCSGSSIALRTTAKEVLSPQEIGKFFGREEGYNPLAKGLSHDDSRFLSLMQNKVRKNDDGHYELPLPFIDSEARLMNNKSAARQRLNGLVKRFERDPEYHKYYVNFMNELLENGFAEQVPAEELADGVPAYYLPHHGVIHPAKPGKVRVVMDASSKCQGGSLNCHLLTGPDLINSLVGILCRFRQDYIAFMCDIKGMFLQFRVAPEDRNFLRFFWFPEGDYTKKPVVYRSTVHLFGLVSSPAVANFALKKAASDAASKYGEDVVEFVHKNFYVDDGLQSVRTEDEAIHMIKRSIQLCHESGLKLHKFSSNSRFVLESVPCENRAESVKKVDLASDQLLVERALGIEWCIESDTFRFRIVVDKDCNTRRGILRTVCSIFDPLGFIAPICLYGKKILQEMCREKCEWDDPLPESLFARWQLWVSELLLLENLTIPRCFKPLGFADVAEASVHHFSDACTTGYGQCTYLRLVNDRQQVHCSLVMAKSRVAPLKGLTIPRLELTAATLSVEVSQLLQAELEFGKLDNFYYTDSKIVLGYIYNSSKRFQVFVANRVQRIHDATQKDQWMYVNTSENPADIASRGATGSQLVQSEWITGPAFLWESQIEVKDEAFEVEISDPEVKVTCLKIEGQVVDTNVFHMNYSSWPKVRRITAICIKFIRNLKRKVRASVTVQDECNAERVLITQAQQSEFLEDFQSLLAGNCVKKDSKLVRLDPFIDDCGMIRVGGRLQQGAFDYDTKHPIVLPKNHATTDLILRYSHNKIAHQGRGMTMNEVRNQGYWIIGLSGKCASMIYHCVTCRRLRSYPVGQKMGELPPDRLEAGPAFSYVAVDYFGPYYIRQGRSEVKRYGVLFTCLNSRAIHVETANSLDSDSFINALRRFMSIRGPVRVLRSDRGTNLVGGYNQLKEEIAKVDDQKVKRFLLDNSCDYMLGVPHASHQGGVWERQIRTLRNVLNTLLNPGSHQLDDESFRTFMAEASYIVNSRPLTVTSLNDSNSLRPLTPNHLLTMKSNVVLPPPGVFQEADQYCTKRWKRVQRLTDMFWNRWKKEVLSLWQIRQKWHKTKINLKVGDIVLVIDESIPRCQWKIARVTDTSVGKDNLVRKATVVLGDPCISKIGKRTKLSTTLERPVHKLILLLES